jgi:acetyl-CoA synthetase/medium-chain acyl-CoA synthetase
VEEGEMGNPEPNMLDYQRTYQEFRLEPPERYNFGFDVVDRWAADPEKPALVWADDDGNEARYTFAEVKTNSNKFANLMGSLGVGKGDRVILMMHRIPDWHWAVVGLIKMGAVPIPCTVLLTPKDLKYRIDTAEVKAVVTDEENAPKVEEVKEQCPTLQAAVILGEERPGWHSYKKGMEQASAEFSTEKTLSDDPCMVYFTSGTTGEPKMVLHTHVSYPLAHVITGKFWLDSKPDDLHWNVSDTGWAKAAYSTIFGPWNMGAAVFVHDSRGKYDPLQTLHLLEKYQISTLCAPPTAYRLLVQEDLSGHKFPALRHCVSAGEPLNPEVIEGWAESTGLTIYDGYGQTETVLLVGNYRCMEVRPGSMGKPTPGFRMGIVDNEGNEVEPGQEGDIAIRVKPERPLGMFKEYWKAPEETAGSYLGDWYITGDRGIADEDGYFWFVGRADDVIISAGYRIGPFEVESALVEHPAVVESAAVASPDPDRGQVVKAFVVLAQGHEPSDALAAELQEHVKKVTAPYKYPRKVEFVDELPKTISGKIRRVELRLFEQEKG